MSRMFTVKWPRFAQVEAALLFPVAVATVGEIIRARLALDGGLMTLLASGGADPDAVERALSLLALTSMTCVPFLGFLMVVDRLLVVRKGFAILSCLATVIWMGAAAVLSNDLASLMPPDLMPDQHWISFRRAAVLAAGVGSFLVHLKILWIGLRDTGFAAMRMGVEQYMEEDDSSSDEYGRPVSRLLKNSRGHGWAAESFWNAFFSAPVRFGFAFVFVGSLIYGSYEWFDIVNHQVVDHEVVDHEVVAHEAAGHVRPEHLRADHIRAGNPIGAPPGLTPDTAGVIAGEAGTGRDSQGRFVFDVTVNGIKMPMVYAAEVPLVTVRAEDGLRLGISFARLDFSQKLKTARGFIDVAALRSRQ